MSSKSQISWSFFMLLFLLCTSVLSVSASINLARKMLNSLGMAAYIGAQRYSQPITHRLMINEAKTALNSLPGGKKTKPAVVSALWDGSDKLIFASSAKGQGTVPGNDDLQIPTPLQDILKKCAAEFGTESHNYDGKCGEIMVIAEWIRENPGKPLPQKKAIIAVNKNGVVPPCAANGERGTYGCEQFLQAMKFDSSEIIDKEPEEEACDITSPGSSTDLGKRACRRPGRATKAPPTKATPKKVNVSPPKGAKPAPIRQAARPVSRRPRQRRSVHPRWNGRMAQ